MILVKCPPLRFNLHTDERERQNVKAKNRVSRKEIISTDLSSFTRVLGLGGVPQKMHF